MERLAWLVKQQLLGGEWLAAARTLHWLAEEHRLERRLGLQTEGKIPQDALEGAADCQSYEALSFRALKLIFQHLAPQAAEPAVFMDVGCGMGRVLVEALQHPYRRVLGLELSPRLVRQARHNLQQAHIPRRCHDWQVEQADAMHHVIADDVTTLCLFNPFRGAVMAGFLQQLQASLARRPRHLQMVVANPVHLDLSQVPWLRLEHQLSVFHPRMSRQANYRMQVIFLAASPVK